MKQTVAFSTILIFSFSLLHGQEDYKKNIVHGNFGTIGVANTIGINYERLIGEPSDKFISSYWMKFGYGILESGFDSFETNNYYSLSISGLTSLKNNHFELSLGASGLDLRGTDASESPSNFRIIPAFTIGYRFQKLTKKGLSFELDGVCQSLFT